MPTRAELVRRYNRPVPRYTSYPPAPLFHAGVGVDTYREYLSRLASQPDEPLALYVHLPFCTTRCWYCGCTAIATPKQSVETRYRDLVLKEVAEVARCLGPRRRLNLLHWGGGTPTYGPAEQLLAFHKRVLEHFTLAPDAELSVEVDPRVTTSGHLARLREGGFNRISMGVQDPDPVVQSEIGRIQPFAQTAYLVESARELGFRSLNVDLIYGLPLQTARSIVTSVQQVLELAPDRLAIYGYAHVPWMHVHQRRIDEAALPTAEERLELFAAARRTLEAAGYVGIGMDHFARPEDELAQAAAAGTLDRTFMGYTVRAAPHTIGVGMSAIGDVAGAYFQNPRRLADYTRAIEQEGLATVRGYVRTEEDVSCGAAIASLLLQQEIDIPAFEQRFALQFREAFADALVALEPLAADGLVEVEADRITMTEAGRPFVRNVCAPFDIHLTRARPSGPRYSSAV